MKFAHFADTHLGFRQYGLIEREYDVYEAFNRVIDDMIKEKVSFVIHSGDLFEASKPSINAIFTAQKGFNKLENAGIPVYCIAGNHDIMARGKSMLPQTLFESNTNFHLLTTKNQYFIYEDIFIGGLSYISRQYKETVKDMLTKLQKKSSNYKNSILILHGSIDKYFDIQPEFTRTIIPKKFSYYAMGHLHKRIKEPYAEGYLSYPGSTEIMGLDELSNYNKMKKGYNLVTLTNGKAEVEFKNINLNRSILKINIDYLKIDETLNKIKEDIENLENKPVLHITIKNGDFDRQFVFKQVHKILDPYVLTIKLIYEPTKLITDLSIDENNKKITANYLIKEHLKEYGENISSFAIELHKQLSSQHTIEASKIANDFYNELYLNKKD